MKAGAAAAGVLLLLVSCGAPQRKELRVCADPNNLPFSNRAGQGFENALARMLARELHSELRIVWRPQRRGAIRETLNTGKCDVIPGIAAGHEMVRSTRPWYRSTYVAVTRAGARLRLSGFDDPQLRSLRIGVQLVGDDGVNTPPAHALARRGIVANVRGFMVQGDYRSPDPQRAIFAALRSRAIDVAYVWGPTAAWEASRAPGAYQLAPTPRFGGPNLPMTFAIAAGVRKDDGELADRLDAALDRLRPEIDRLLRRYRVPAG